VHGTSPALRAAPSKGGKPVKSKKGFLIFRPLWRGQPERLGEVFKTQIPHLNGADTSGLLETDFLRICLKDRNRQTTFDVFIFSIF